MSVVTNVIVSVLGEEDGVKKLNEWLAENHYRAGQLSSHTDNCSGGKALECDLYVGAFNSLNIEEFISAFKSIEWRSYSSAQLLIKDQDADRFIDDNAWLMEEKLRQELRL